MDAESTSTSSRKRDFDGDIEMGSPTNASPCLSCPVRLIANAQLITRHQKKLGVSHTEYSSLENAVQK